MAESFITQRAKTSEINQISQSTLLLKKKKEMHQVDDALDATKEEYKRRMEACEQRQRKFQVKQNDMKDQVSKFEKFIQENDSKRQRAELKAKSERRLLEQKEAELRTQHDELRGLEKDRADLIAQLEKLRKYKEYLEKAVESADDESAEEIWDLVNRHATLKNANVDLTEQVQRGDVEMDDLRTTMENLKLKTQSIALVQNSQMNDKQKLLDTMRAKTKHDDDLKLTREERVKDVTRATAEIVNAVRNLYHRCLITMRTRVTAVEAADLPDDSPQEQLKKLTTCLDLIGDRINDLDDIRASATDAAPHAPNTR